MLSTDTEERIQVVSSSLPATSQQFNPYHLSNVNNGYEENNRISRNFDTSTTNAAKNTDYYFYMRRIYSFWYEYLPSLYKNYQDRTGRSSSEQDQFLENCEHYFVLLIHIKLIELFPATPKYKHAFFSMLALVCLLLAILGVCVYILKKNNKSISSATSILWQKFMFRSRLLIDRRIFRARQSRENSPMENETSSRRQLADNNNNINNNLRRTTLSNNFDFIEPCDIEDQIDSLESVKIKNWRYHLTNNKF